MVGTTHRPIGATLIAVVLFLLSVNALGALVILKADHNAASFPPFSPAAHFLAALHSSLYTILALWYAISGFMAGVGIWRMYSWASWAFLVWSVAVVSLGGFYIWAAPSELIMGGKLAGLTFVVFVAVLLGLAYRYLSRLPVSPSHVAL